MFIIFHCSICFLFNFVVAVVDVKEQQANLTEAQKR